MTTIHLELANQKDSHYSDARKEELIESCRKVIKKAKESDNLSNVYDLLDIINSSHIHRAGSDACGDLDVFSIDPRSELSSSDLSEIVRLAQKDAWNIAKTDITNNLSPTVESVVTGAQSSKSDGTNLPTVGLLLPGGNAAPRDVISKAENYSDRLDNVESRVFLSKSNDLVRDMINAFDELKSKRVVAIVVGFGGGQESTLKLIFGAIAKAAAGTPIPVYIGIGHANFTAQEDLPNVTWCKTPSAAFDLFIEESVRAPEREKNLLDSTYMAIKAAGANRLEIDLAWVEFEKDLQLSRSERISRRADHIQN
ncbi:hypothetical protein [Arthrobacter alpinus]|uniref:hypothetical protein n=1 Tax=Arthrobacter alpinus TaxID=656366 RepID=UPI001645FA8B|nr:hypothetical protein [Arthrobacter alpinus]